MSIVTQLLKESGICSERSASVWEIMMPPIHAMPDKAVILVVDDEPILRMIAVDLVEEAGFEALEAANADEAIHLLESRDGIRLILTDIDMPAGSMNGLKLAAAVRHRWPPIEIIVVSGHYHAKAEDLPEGVLFFPKPYKPAEIVSVMQRLVA
jgi:CheY-like chemotaxis protein